jgi:hypothetical protein
MSNVRRHEQMNEVAYQRNFPPSVEVPEILLGLLRFQNQAQEWYSDHFKLDIWEYGKAAWFEGDTAAAKQFIAIGHGPDDSQYAFWIYSGRTIQDAPIVFLGSEGTGCGVVAASLSQFLSLLAVGSEELGFAAAWGEIAQAEQPATRLIEFRSWLESSYGIEPPKDPRDVVKESRMRHPDFSPWLSAWQAQRP